MSVHLKVPFEIAGGRALTVPDGSVEEVVQNVEVIVSTFRGERLTIPDFGLEDPTFGFAKTSPAGSEIEAAVARFEPRAELTFQHRGPGSLTVGVKLREAD